MSSLSDNCETEIEWFKSIIIPKLLKEQKLVNGISENDFDKFQIKDVTVEVIGTQEAFMLTKCYRACLTYEYKGAVDAKHFFVKKSPQLPQDVFDAINFKALFNNEILTYETIIPCLESFGKFHLNTAKFYYGELKSNAATIITEDFGAHNWTVTKDRFNLSLDHTLLAVKYLAQFHAVGFALRATDKRKFHEITQGLKESRFSNDEVHPQWDLQLKTALQRILKVTREYQKDVKDEFLDKYAELVANPNKYCRRVVEPKEPFVTLCHGDYLRNNVAYKYEEAEGANKKKPIDIMMFDLQTLRVSSPMIDLSTFLALSTLAEVRQKHFREIFEAYSLQLKESYEKFAQQPLPNYLSYEPLLKEYIRFLPYSVSVCSWFLMELVEPNSLSGEEFLNQEVNNNEVIKKALTKGGDIVDRELAQQMKEMYDLSTQHNVDIF